MKQTISNKFMTVSAHQKGAELCSIQSTSGTEYLWQADTTIWGRHAPILFPIVGKLADDHYTIDGKSFHLPQHGFARDMTFQLEEVTDVGLVYGLHPTAATHKLYPFAFALKVHYELTENTLTTRYTVHNEDTQTLPFSIGAHPGFGLNWGAEDSIEDYFLEFNKDEPLTTHLLGNDHLFSGKIEHVPCDNGRLAIHKTLFDQDALIFWGLQSDKVTLGSHKHDQRLTVAFTGFPHLGIWAKPGAPFVCIEPWYGHADISGTNGTIMNKPGIIKLAAGETYECSFSISIEQH